MDRHHHQHLLQLKLLVVVINHHVYVIYTTGGHYFADQVGCAIAVMIIIIISRRPRKWVLTNTIGETGRKVYLTQKIACQIANNQYCRSCLKLGHERIRFSAYKLLLFYLLATSYGDSSLGKLIEARQSQWRLRIREKTRRDEWKKSTKWTIIIVIMIMIRSSS